MKYILFITGQLQKGGQEKQLILLLKDSEIHNFKIILFNWSGLFDNQNLSDIKLLKNVSYISLRGKNFFEKIKDIIIQSKKCSLLVSFTSYLNFLVFLISIYSKKKFAGSARITLDNELKRFSGWLNLLFVPNVLSNSNHALLELKKRSFFKTHYLLNNRLDVSLIPSSIVLKKKYKSISISTVNERKNLNYLIDIAIHRKNNGKYFNHVHLGNGPLLEYYREKVKDLGLNDSINFIGKVDNVYEYLRNSHLFLHFSYYEGTPNAILEALSVGLFILAIKSGDLNYLVVQKKTGIIFEKWELIKFDKWIDSSTYSNNITNNLPLKYQYNNDGSYFKEFLNIANNIK